MYSFRIYDKTSPACRTLPLRREVSFRCIHKRNLKDNERYIKSNRMLLGRNTPHEIFQRIENGETLYIILHKGHPYGSAWFVRNYMYDVFFGKERSDNDIPTIMTNLIDQYDHPDSINAVTVPIDDSNVRSYNYFFRNLNNVHEVIWQ